MGNRTMKGILLGVLGWFGDLFGNPPLHNLAQHYVKMDEAVRHIRSDRGYRPAFNGRQPSVKRAHRQAKAARAQRRARRLGHA